MNIFKKAMGSVLDLVIKEKEFLSKNPKYLVYLMNEYQNIHSASHYHENSELHDQDNPKDDIAELENHVSEEYSNLVYAAWAFLFKDKTGHKLEYKKNKTLDELVGMHLDPDYLYHKMNPHKKVAMNHLMCLFGTGYNWNADGFLEKCDGPDDIDVSLFWNWDKKSLPEKWLKKCIWRKNKDIIKCLEKLQEDLIQRKADDAAKDKIFNDRIEKIQAVLEMMESDGKTDTEDYKLLIEYAKPILAIYKHKPESEFVFSNLVEKYSPICNMPENAHESYRLGLKQICNWIIENPSESKTNKTIAQKLLNQFQ